MTQFELSLEPYDYIISVHINNMFHTYGEEIVRGYINQTLTEVPYCYQEIHRHITNLILTYGEDVVFNCWKSLFTAREAV